MLFVLLMAVVLMAGCSAEDGPEEVVDPELNGEEEAVTETDQTVVEELTKQLLEEEGIEQGQVFIHKDMVIATMVISEGIEEEAVVQLAEKYAGLIEEQYPDYKINVQAVRDGESLVDLLIE